jgi:hypothetical protein
MEEGLGRLGFVAFIVHQEEIYHFPFLICHLNQAKARPSLRSGSEAYWTKRVTSLNEKWQMVNGKWKIF